MIPANGDLAASSVKYKMWLCCVYNPADLGVMESWQTSLIFGQLLYGSRDRRSSD